MTSWDPEDIVNALNKYQFDSTVFKCFYIIFNLCQVQYLIVSTCFEEQLK